ELDCVWIGYSPVATTLHTVQWIASSQPTLQALRKLQSISRVAPKCWYGRLDGDRTSVGTRTQDDSSGVSRGVPRRGPERAISYVFVNFLYGAPRRIHSQSCGQKGPRPDSQRAPEQNSLSVTSIAR